MLWISLKPVYHGKSESAGTQRCSTHPSFLTCCLLQLRRRSGSFSSFFKKPFSGSEGQGLFFSRGTERVGRARGCSVAWEASTTSLSYQTWWIQLPWQLFFGAKRWVRRGWRQACEWTQTELTPVWRRRQKQTPSNASMWWRWVISCWRLRVLRSPVCDCRDEIPPASSGEDRRL